MKLIKKFLGIAVIITVIGFMALPLTGCSEETEESKKSVTPTSIDTSGDPIESISIEIPAPAKDGTPATKAIINPDDNFTSGDITWTPTPPNNKFEGGKEYTAKVKLTAKDGYTFYGLTKDDVLINGNENPTTFTNNAKTVDLTYKSVADNRTVTGITISVQPKTTYNYNEELDLSDLKVKITYDDTSFDDNIPFTNFGSKSLTTDPINGTKLSVADNNGKVVKVQHGSGKFANTNALTVNPIDSAADNFTVNGAEQTYNGSPKSVTVSAKSGITGMGNVSNIQYEGTGSTSYTKSTTAPTNAGTYTVTFDVAPGTNYKTANSLAGTLTINKATPVVTNFNISGLGTFDYENGVSRTVNVTVKDGIQGMGTVTVKYNGDLTAIIGTYTVTFDVVAGTNYTAANLPAGTLTINFKTPTLTTVADLNSLLASLPANTANTVYPIKLNVSTLSSTLSGYYKYVNLDLSGSTFTSMPSGAFGWDYFTGITLPNSVTSIGERAFYGCTGLTSITIPNSVTSIGNYAFYGCWDLTSLTIGSGVTIIGNFAFSNCGALTSLIIPNSVTSIGSNAFSSCSGLTSLTIGSGVTSIGNSAFGQIGNHLTSVTFNCTISESNFASSSFSWSGDLRAKYLAGGIGTYKSANGYEWTKQ
jgi:hypothetical protein